MPVRSTFVSMIAPTTQGETTPPRFPIMFMAPESEPTPRPPMSMQVVHDPGSVRSMAKLASEIRTTAAYGSSTRVEA